MKVLRGRGGSIQRPQKVLDDLGRLFNSFLYIYMVEMCEVILVVCFV